MGKLVALIEAVITGGQAVAAPAPSAAGVPAAQLGLGPLASDAFKCMRSYLKAGITLAGLQHHREGRLLKLLLVALGCEDEQLMEQASDTLVDLLGEAAMVRFPPTREASRGPAKYRPATTSSESSAAAAAIVVVAAGVQAQQPRFRKAVAESDAEVCVAWCDGVMLFRLQPGAPLTHACCRCAASFVGSSLASERRQSISWQQATLLPMRSLTCCWSALSTRIQT